MRIDQYFTNNSLRNFNYILESEGGDVFILDPWDATSLQKHLGEKFKRIKAIVNTHEHWDHIQGNEAIQAATGCEVMAHANAAGKIPGVTRLLRAQDVITLDAKHELEVLDTPGHTFAHVCLLLKEEGRPQAVFTGDTLFNAGVGNCKHGGDPAVLYQTISEIFEPLPDDIKVYPGHEYLVNNLGFSLNREPGNAAAQALLQTCRNQAAHGAFHVTDMGEEKRINPFLRLDNEEVVKGLPISVQSKKEVFIELRKLRDRW